MKWNHLPEPGGLYQQHPELLDKFMYIFNARAEEQERKHKEEERKRKHPNSARGVAGGRRR
jgi:hypothetical protein